jgi:hypothetical protein
VARPSVRSWGVGWGRSPFASVELRADGIFNCEEAQRWIGGGDQEAAAWVQMGVSGQPEEEPAALVGGEGGRVSEVYSLTACFSCRLRKRRH